MCSRAHAHSASELKSASVIHLSLMILMAKHPIFHTYLILIVYRLLKVGLPVLLQCVNTGNFVREYCDVNSFASSLILINLLSVGCYCVLNIAEYYFCFHMVCIKQH